MNKKLPLIRSTKELALDEDTKVEGVPVSQPHYRTRYSSIDVWGLHPLRKTRARWPASLGEYSPTWLCIDPPRSTQSACLRWAA